MRVVKINAIWCSACLVMNKRWNQVLKQYPVETKTLDYDMDEEEVKKYEPGNILPVFIFYQKEHEVMRTVGEKTEEELLKIVGDILEKESY